MKSSDQYLKFVRWSDEDRCYIGYCPDLFPWGGVCHGEDEAETYRILCELVADEVRDLKASDRTLPEATTRPMREVAIG
jgi:hypothetical protein